MASSDGYVYVDDRDPRIVYSANWGLSDPSDAYDGTLHGISVAGGTATLTFAGTTISVVGGVGDVEQYGWPSSSYSIDGKVYATLDEATDLNLNDPSQFIYNFTYWDSPNLSPGEHTLIITTQNGTSPNTYWLDYIRFLPLGSSTSAASTVSSTSPSSAASISRSQSPTNAQASASISSASPQLSATSTSPQTTPINGTGSLPSSSQPASKGTDAVVANTSSHSQHTGAIIGGAIGGAVCLALLAIIGVYLFLKRRLRTEQRGQLFPRMLDDAPTESFLPPASAPGVGPLPSATIPHSLSALLSSDMPAMSERTAPAFIRAPSVRKDRTVRSHSQSQVETLASEDGAFHEARASIGNAEHSTPENPTGSLPNLSQSGPSSGPFAAKAAQSAVVQELDSGIRGPLLEDAVTTLPPPYSAD